MEQLLADHHVYDVPDVDDVHDLINFNNFNVDDVNDVHDVHDFDDFDHGTDDHYNDDNRGLAAATASAATVVKCCPNDDVTTYDINDRGSDHDDHAADNTDVHHRDTSNVATDDCAEHSSSDRSIGSSRNRRWRCGHVVRQRSPLDGQRNGPVCWSRRTSTHRTPSTSGVT
jgi:hypothetical protein